MLPIACSLDSNATVFASLQLVVSGWVSGALLASSVRGGKKGEGPLLVLETTSRGHNEKCYCVIGVG